jgi:hypothetical protein
MPRACRFTLCALSDSALTRYRWRPCAPARRKLRCCIAHPRNEFVARLHLPSMIRMFLRFSGRLVASLAVLISAAVGLRGPVVPIAGNACHSRSRRRALGRLRPRGDRAVVARQGGARPALVCRGLCHGAGVVGHHPAVAGPRLGRRRGAAARRACRRQHGHDAERAQLRLAQRHRLHPALGNPPLRPGPPSLGRRVALVLERPGHRAHARVLRLRRRPVRHLLHRDPQGARRELLVHRRLLQAVRDQPRCGRRARHPARAHQRARRRRLHVPRALPQPEMRSLFLGYLGEGAALVRAPSFYNTLTANCTTIVYALAKHVVPGLPMDWRLLASGYLPEYLHDVGGPHAAPQHGRASRGRAHHRTCARLRRQPRHGKLLASHPERIPVSKWQSMPGPGHDGFALPGAAGTALRRRAAVATDRLRGRHRRLDLARRIPGATPRRRAHHRQAQHLGRGGAARDRLRRRPVPQERPGLPAGAGRLGRHHRRAAPVRALGGLAAGGARGRQAAVRPPGPLRPKPSRRGWRSARHAYAYLFFTARKPRDRAFEDRQTQVRDYYNYAVQQAITGLFSRYRQEKQ